MERRGVIRSFRFSGCVFQVATVLGFIGIEIGLFKSIDRRLKGRQPPNVSGPGVIFFDVMLFFEFDPDFEFDYLNPKI